MTVQNYLALSNGLATKTPTVETGPTANSIPNTTSAGIIDPTLLNATVTSAGAGSANKLTQLDSTGRLDSSVMPVGVTPEVITVLTSEALAAGDFVNVYNNAGTPNVRKADASAASAGKIANGFVLAAFGSAANASVYLEGINTQVTGKTPGALQWLSAATPGRSVELASIPTTAGQSLQPVGYAVSATAIAFNPQFPIIL